MDNKVKVKPYQFQNICTQMEREFGRIKKGEEERHAMMLFPIESNLLKVHRAYPASNSRRLLEAIPIVLFQIKSYLSGEDYDVDKYISEDNQRLVNAALMAFDPFTNAEVKEVINKEQFYDLRDRDVLKQFYQEPVICILRICDSIKTFEKQMGGNGYFDFLENTMGHLIPQDNEMKFAVLGSKKNRS